MRVLITGGLGFLGSNLAYSLVQDGHEVVLLDKWTASRANIEDFKDSELVNVVYGDVRDFEIIAGLVKDVNVVYHFASQVSHIKSMEDPYLDVDVNCRGTLNILEAVRKFNPQIPVIYTSSRSVYGFPKHLPINEEHPTNPIDAYGITKLAGEKYCRLYNYHYALNTVCFRMANLFGERQQLWTSEYQMIAWVFRQTLLGETIQFYGDGTQTRDFLYVGDAVTAYRQAYKHIDRLAGGVYNLAGKDYCAWNEVFQVCSEALEKPVSVKYIEYTPLRKRLENPHSRLDGTKIRKIIGWEPTVGLLEGFRRMKDYYTRRSDILPKYLGR